jgi:hypothetical protein
MTTETIQHGNLADALAAFQAEMPVVAKSSINPHFKSKFADLADITVAIIPLLTKHGLAFTVTPRAVDSQYEIAGVLMHGASSEVIEGALPLTGRSSQEMGSAITYARRYLLCCLTGVVTDEPDDDGNMATTNPVRTVSGLSKDQVAKMTAYFNQGVNVSQEIENVLGRPGTTSDMTAAEGDRVLEHLATMPIQASA